MTDNSVVSHIREDGKTGRIELIGYGAETWGDKIFNELKADKRVIYVVHTQVHSGGFDIRQKYVKD